MSGLYVNPGFREYDLMQDMLNWAHEHCASYITCTSPGTFAGDAVYQMHISDPVDIMAFRMMWNEYVFDDFEKYFTPDKIIT